MRVAAALLFLLLVIGACVRDTDDDDIESVTDATATTGGETSCDTGQAGSFDISVVPCSDCAFCAVQARCADETAKCPALVSDESDPTIPCDAFRDCVAGCFDLHDTNMNGVIDGSEGAAFDACAGTSDSPQPGTCMGDNPMGWDHYIALLSCIVCDECPINCDAANACGP